MTKLEKHILAYLISFSDMPEYPIVYQNDKVLFYQSFIGLNCDGASVTFENIKEVAVLCDQLHYKESMSDNDVLKCLKYSNEIQELKANLLEFVLHEFPLDKEIDPEIFKI